MQEGDEGDEGDESRTQEGGTQEGGEGDESRGSGKNPDEEGEEEVKEEPEDDEPEVHLNLKAGHGNAWTVIAITKGADKAQILLVTHKQAKDTGCNMSPREVCEDVVVTEQAEAKDKHQVGGTVAGAAVGGILGNQVGSGRGKSVATAAGAAAGGYLGNKAHERYQEGNTTTSTERQCTTVTDSEERVIGYLVTYDLDGKTGTIKMDNAPSGSTLPVVDGKVAL